MSAVRGRERVRLDPVLRAVGEITLKDDNGNDAVFSYCDVWRFEDGRLAELDAFVIALAELRTTPVNSGVAVAPLVCALFSGYLRTRHPIQVDPLVALRGD